MRFAQTNHGSRVCAGQSRVCANPSFARNSYMGEGYGCSNFQCSTLANAIKFHTQLQAGCRCTSDKEAFLYIRLRMTPQYSIDRSQRRKDYMYCTHARFTCEVNGFVQIPYMRAVHMLHAHLPIAF